MRCRAQLYEHYDLRAISTRKVSFQCPDTGIQEKEWCHPSA
ncbi:MULTISPECIES: hypothetical protein [unclassified Wolbachia]|nr:MULTISPECIES: hypothetical protein [unclassified Wolbachia]